MRRLLLSLVLVCLCGGSAFAQTFYNPTTIQFESASHASTVLYRIEFWIAGSSLTGPPVQSANIPIANITVAAVGPPVTYQLLIKDVPIFVPFGKSYVVRLFACDNTQCSNPSEVTRETIRYAYCVLTPTTLKQLTIVQAALPIGVVGAYAPVTMTLDAAKPIHSVSIALMGSGEPAFYFTGLDLRGAVTFTVGPLKRAGRYLVNINAADEAGCSANLATQYLTVR